MLVNGNIQSKDDLKEKTIIMKNDNIIFRKL